MRSQLFALVFVLVFALACGDDDGGSDAAVDAARVDAPTVDARLDAPGTDTNAPDARPDPECGNDVCERGESTGSCAEDCPPCTLPDDATELEQTLVGLEADTWYEVPDTLMRDVCVDDSVGVRGVSGCPAIITAWSGGTLDTSRNRMLIWGGGHDDYHGNEVFWSMGSGDILVWDITASALVTDAWVTTGGRDYSNADVVGDRTEQLFESGGGDVYDASAPGVDYDAAADALVAWANAGGPYALDLASRTWTRGSGDGAPVSENSGGTFGRWRYIPAYNVFILVNSVDENVRFYKHTRCDGA